MGVAVNTGHVVVGNIGSEKRAKYGAVGSQVNFTGRVESFTVGGQVLVSPATYERLSAKLDVENVLEVEMKGVPGKVKLYDVRGITGDHQARLPEKDETLAHLTEGIGVQVFSISEKILDGTGTGGVITHASLTSAKIVFNRAVALWEDLRIVPEGHKLGKTAVEIYGKVISVSDPEHGVEAVVRFTSVPAEAYEMLRELLRSAKSR
jgi:hypothetical protein